MTENQAALPPSSRPGPETSFARRVWRLLVGIKDAMVLVLLLGFFSLIFAALSARPGPAKVREGALLLELNGSLVEEVSAFDPTSLLLPGIVPTGEFATRDLVAAIDEAAGDERIEAIALDLSMFLGGGQVHVQEVAEALDRFRAAGKPVFAYAVAYTDDSLMLAAHADEVWVDPLGGAAIRGPGGERLYFAGLLERFDIKANVYRVGTYKSAVEPYIETQMSPAARENAEAIYSSLWEEWLANVRRARPQARIDAVVQDLPALIAENGNNLASAALAAGLVDRAGTREEWGEHIAQEVGEDPLDSAPGSFASTPLDSWLAEIEAPGMQMRGFSGSGEAIAVVTVAGEISDGNAGPGEAGAVRIAALLDEALDDGPAALVVRIDSPGGTVTGSEAIRRAILRHKAKGTPIAISMGNYAASGGYWIATAGDRLFAAPETLTGSIGVFAVLPTFDEFLARYGVTSDGVRTTPLSGQPDLFAGLTPQADALLQASVEANYAQFLALVAEARGIETSRADALGQGRVWTGGTARQLGLVDQFGGLQDAIEWAAAKAQLDEDEWHVRYLGGEPDPFAAMIAGMAGVQGRHDPARDNVGHDLFARLARGQQDLAARLLADLDMLVSAQGVQARCLECLALQPPRPARQAGDRAGQAWLTVLAERFLRD